MKRRAFITVLGSAAAWPLVARAQQPPDRMWRIGWLHASPSADRYSIALADAFKSKLRDLGYVEGKNITFDHRYGEGNYDRLPALASELVALAPDVIVSGSTVTTAALQRSTSSIPIVMTVSTDPIGNGFIKSLAKPGGNVTGLSNQGPDYTAKSLEILHSITPNARRIAVLRSPSIAHETLIKESYEAADALGVKIIPVLARTQDDLDEAFLTMQKENCDALFVLIDPRITPKIVELAAKLRLPAMYQATEFVKLGGLSSYSPVYREMFQRAAIYVDKILRGASPADLPVERPTRFELAINLKTAKALGLEVPSALLARTDEVIE
jgi:putative tryptophan/tyrosine transport system substrate-binding protein